MNPTTIKSFLLVILITILNFPQQSNYSNLTLNDCVKIALEKNKQQDISKKQLQKSEAQLKQANSSRLPQFDISILAYMNDQDINFIQPPLKMDIPPINLGGMPISFPTLEIPAQEFKIADNKSLLSEAMLTFPLYTGGKISSIIDQAKLGINISDNDLQITESEIKFNIRNTFYTIVLTRNVSKIGNDALQRFETTFKLTESMYKAGSGKVNKLDYLKNKMALEAFRGMNSTIISNYKTALSALKFYMGLEQSDEVSIRDSVNDYNLDLVENYLNKESLTESNFTLQKLENSINVYKFKMDEAKSDYYPSIALIGNFSRWDNSYKYATFTKENQNIFTVGVGLKWNLFSGFRTEGKTEEIQADLSQIKSQKNYFNDGLRMQKEKLINELNESKEKIASSKEAMLTSIENRELNLKAYQNDMASVSDFIEAQLFEAILCAQYEEALFNQANTIFKLENLFGDMN